MSEKPALVDIRYRYEQDNDSCDSNTDGQCLTVQSHNAGGGWYLTLKTKRWALNADELDEFVAMLRGVLALEPKA